MRLPLHVRSVSRALRVFQLTLACLLTISQSVRAQAQTPPAPSPVPPTTVPVFNRANDLLPAWLRVRGEFRERVEGFTGAQYTADRDDMYWLSRFRLNASITPSKMLSFTVQAQDARVASKEVGTTAAPFTGTFDLRQGYADVGHVQTSLLRLGRQELVYGDQRLVGHVSWLNTARTFDGARMALRRKPVQIDTFVASVVRIQDDEFDKSGNGNMFAGSYIVLPTLVHQASVEPYVFFRTDRNLKSELGPTARLKSTTIGGRWTGKLPARLDYVTEMATQVGSLGGDKVRAWAGQWQMRYTPPSSHAVRFGGEYNYASGDANPTDGTRGTFDVLYPTPHDKYGLADQVGWKNIHHARAGFEFTPLKGMPIVTNYHSWWLADVHDGLYTAGGATSVARIPTGAPARHVGQELDVQVSRALTPQIQLAGGFAHIFPGSFLNLTTPGASYNYPYVSVTYVFLAEK